METLFKFKPIVVNLRLFDVGPLNASTDGDLSDEFKTYYSKYLLTKAKPKLVHDQLAQTVNIPGGSGKIVEFRRIAAFPKALTPITEGVTPNGETLSVSHIDATVLQFGSYTVLTDVLELTALDNLLLATTNNPAAQAGETLDTVTREVINAGEAVQYARGDLAARHLLTGGEVSDADNDYMSVQVIKRAVRTLKVNNTPKDGEFFASIIHMDAVNDLMNDESWLDAMKYGNPDNMFKGEVGRIAGVRFIETSEAKVFHAEDLVTITNLARNLTVKTAITTGTVTVALEEAISTAEATALTNRYLIIEGELVQVHAATAGVAGSATLTLEANIANVAEHAVIYPGEAGAAGRDVYSTLICGKDAYGVTSIDGGALRHIFMPKGSGGTSDPLRQRSTVGWIASKTAIILQELYMVRVETATSFNDIGAN